MKLAGDIAAALFFMKYKRPMKKKEQMFIHTEIANIYRMLRVGPSRSASHTLEQLRSNAIVREIIDVTLEPVTVATPHSFVFDYRELVEVIERYQAVVVPEVGCIFCYKNELYLCSIQRQEKLTTEAIRTMFEHHREMIAFSN